MEFERWARARSMIVQHRLGPKTSIPTLFRTGHFMNSVLDFGATGDGKTDDTDALQHALEAGDGVLRLKKGTFRITRPIVLNLVKQGFGAVRGDGGTSR